MQNSPKDSSLTYKHPYWWDHDYQARWDAWDSGGRIGEEPVSYELNISSCITGPVRGVKKA